MKKIIISLCLFGLLSSSYAAETQSDRFLSPVQALEKLKSGNTNYMNQDSADHDFRSKSKKGSMKGQFPFAFILSCMDSRSIPEVIFDQNAGSLFIARVAGNVLSKNMLGSMEYAALVGTKLFVVMGHSSCGAVIAGCEKAGFDNINHILAEITPAVPTDENLNCKDAGTIAEITKKNVSNMVKMASAQSEFLKNKINNKEILIVGAVHNLKTGKVEFLS